MSLTQTLGIVKSKSPKRLITSTGAFYPTTRMNNTNDYIILGVDNTDNRLLVRNYTNGQLLQSEDYATGFTTFSTNKGYPANFNVSTYHHITRWGAYLYIVGCTTGDATIAKIWRTLPQSGNTTFTWTLVCTMTATTSLSPLPKIGVYGNLSYVFAGEYGDPNGGANIWRSADGETWTKCYTNANVRHIHHVAPDTYKEGWVWATCGDASSPANLLLSTDNGANWSIIESDTNFQGVQLSFDADWVYIAGDSNVGLGCLNVVNRDELDVKVGCLDTPKNIPVPGSCPCTAGYIRGMGNPVTDLTGFDKGFKIQIDGDTTQNNITLDNNVTGLAIAADMQVKIRAIDGTARGVDYSGVTVTYSDDGGLRYRITSGTKGSKSMVRMYAGTADVSWRLKLGVANTDQTVYTIDGKSERFSDYAYYGIVDPSTGVYYCITVDLADSTQKYGLFYAPYVGGGLILLEVLPNHFDAGRPIYLNGDYIYFGQYKRKKITTQKI